MDCGLLLLLKEAEVELEEVQHEVAGDELMEEEVEHKRIQEGSADSDVVVKVACAVLSKGAKGPKAYSDSLPHGLSGLTKVLSFLR